MERSTTWWSAACIWIDRRDLTYANVQDQEPLTNKTGGPGGRRCWIDLCRQRIVPVPKTPGKQSGR